MPLDRIDGEILFDIDINALEQALQGIGWVSGWAVTPVSGQLKVSVAEGSGMSEGTTKSTTGATEITLDAADATHPRKDLIVYDASASALAKVTGIAAAIDPAGESNPRKMKVPKPPDLGESKDILIACVYVPANCTDATNCTIIDKRVKLTSITYTECYSDENIPDPESSSWVDWDISGIVVAGTKYAEIYIRQVSLSHSLQVCGVRKKGSSTERKFDLWGGATGDKGTGFVHTEVPSNAIIQVYQYVYQENNCYGYRVVGYWL